MCSTLVPSRGLCRIFPYRTSHTLARLFLRVTINIITNDMRFPLDNSVCRVETTCPLVRLDNLGGVYMTPGRLSRRDEFTPVPSHGSTFVYMIPPQKVMPARVAPA